MEKPVRAKERHRSLPGTADENVFISTNYGYVMGKLVRADLRKHHVRQKAAIQGADCKFFQQEVVLSGANVPHARTNAQP